MKTVRSIILLLTIFLMTPMQSKPSQIMQAANHCGLGMSYISATVTTICGIIGLAMPRLSLRSSNPIPITPSVPIMRSFGLISLWGTKLSLDDSTSRGSQNSEHSKQPEDISLMPNVGSLCASTITGVATYACSAYMGWYKVPLFPLPLWVAFLAGKDALASYNNICRHTAKK